LLLESRHHILDLANAGAKQLSTYGPVVSAAMAAIRQTTDCQRVYSFSLGEAVPHYHLHLIPRTESLPKAYRGRGIMQYPLSPQADEALMTEICERLKRALNRSPVLT